MKVGNDIFDILNGLGFRIKMFNEEGKISTDAEESTRFYSESPNIMISIEPEDNIIKLARGGAHSVEEMEPIRKRIKELAGDSLMKFEYKIFNKNITPKDQAYQIKRETMEGIDELRKLAGLEESASEYSYTLEYNGEENGMSKHKLSITSPEGETKEIADDFTYFDVEGDELQAELESWFHKGMGVADASVDESINEEKNCGCGQDPCKTYGKIKEAEYQGRKVKLGKPTRGDVKKFKVYVKDPKTGNVKKVNFGHGGSSVKGKAMKIRKNNPKARKSFRARHNCDSPGPKTKARYWSCKKW